MQPFHELHEGLRLVIGRSSHKWPEKTGFLEDSLAAGENF
jgi:hypothetical protein